jgi:hypothetical protein
MGLRQMLAVQTMSKVSDIGNWTANGHENASFAKSRVFSCPVGLIAPQD